MSVDAVRRSRVRGFGVLLALVLAVGVFLAPRAGAEPTIHRVGPGDDVQATIDAAAPGDLILLAEGIYDGEWEVDTDDLTIRGLDRNEVILDGDRGDAPDAQENAITVEADGVALENMTARNYQRNGFYWRGVTGFEGRYLTTYRIGAYGIYSFDSAGVSAEDPAVFEHSYASGSADAGFYIGQCRPCNAVVRNVTAEHNALGYSGTNSGGELVIADSEWRLNAAGIVPNSLDSQADPPQRGGSLITGNTVSDNGNPDTPSLGIAGALMGHGVAIAGGNDNVVEGNVLENNTKYGVVLFPMPGGVGLYPPGDNTIRDNEARDNTEADLALAAGSGTGNCFEANDFGSSGPPGIEETHACDGLSLSAAPVAGDPIVAAVLARDLVESTAGLQERPPYTEMPDAPPQETMPDPDPEADS